MTLSPRSVIRSADDVIRVADSLGNHWFAPSMFKTRINRATFRPLTPNGNVGVFVTSDHTFDGRRMYSIRYWLVERINGEDSIDVGSVAFVEYRDRATAVREANRLTVDDILTNVIHSPVTLSPLTVPTNR